MARNVTLSQLRSDARLYSDQRPGGSSAFITDTELTRLINLKLAELYDMLVAARGHEYYLSEATLTTVNGTKVYSLPADFYQLYTLTLEWASNEHEAVDSFESLFDRATFTTHGTWSRWAPKAYRLRGSQLELLPTPTSVVTGRLQYVPAFEDLALDADTFDGVNGWEKLVTLGVAMEMRAIEEQPYNDLAQLYGEQRERIEALAADRAATATKQVVNVFPEGRPLRWPYHGRVQ